MAQMVLVTDNYLHYLHVYRLEKSKIPVCSHNSYIHHPTPLVLVVLRGFAEELEVPTENRGAVGGLRHLHGCRPRF